MKLQLKVQLILIPIILMPTIGIGWLAVHHLREEAATSYRDRLQNTLERLSLIDGMRSERVSAVLDALPDHLLVHAALENHGKIQSVIERDRVLLIHMLESFIDAAPTIDGIFLVKPDGTFIFAGPPLTEQRVLQSGLLPDASPSRFEAPGWREGKLVSTRDHLSPLFIRSVPVQSGQAVKHTGADTGDSAHLLLTLNFNHLQRHFQSPSKPGFTEFLLIDSSGQVILRSGKRNGPDRSEQPGSASEMPALPGTMAGVDVRHRDHMTLARSLGAPGLTLVGAVPLERIQTVSQTLERRVLLILVIAALLCIFLTVSMIRRLVLDRLKFLEQELDNIERGREIPLASRIGGNDEISKLTRKFLDLNRQIGTSRHALRLARYHNPKTGLPNEFGLKDTISLAIHDAQLHSRHAALLLLEINDYDVLTDGMTRPQIKQFLQNVSASLTQLAQEQQPGASSTSTAGYHHNNVGHLEEAEFCIVLRGVNAPENAKLVAERITPILDQAISLGEQQIRCRASIGLAVAPHDADNAAGLLQCAKLALADAKKLGSASGTFFDPNLRQHAKDRITIQSRFPDALRNHEFLLH